MRRVAVFGTTGSGKSWLAERLAERAGLRVVELDALFWGRDWQPAPVDLFRHRVERETNEDGWIVVWHPADTLVWLDLPLPVVMSRLLRRTVKRAVTREELWGTGNRETLSNAFLSRNSILLYALKTHGRNRERFAKECDALAGEKRVVRLRSQRDIERFVLSPLP